MNLYQWWCEHRAKWILKQMRRNRIFPVMDREGNSILWCASPKLGCFISVDDAPSKRVVHLSIMVRWWGYEVSSYKNWAETRKRFLGRDSMWKYWQSVYGEPEFLEARKLREEMMGDLLGVKEFLANAQG